MSSQYQKCYANKGIVAYTRVDDPKDHLFAFASAPTAPNTYPSLTQLLAAWSGAGGSPIRRSILFCQVFDLATLGAALDHFIDSGGLDQCWGKFVYWEDTKFTGGAFSARVPNVRAGSRTVVTAGDMTIRLEKGNVPKTLDGFKFSVLANDDIILSLASGAASWSVAGVAGATDTLTLSITPGSGFAAGSIGLDIPWTTTDSHGAHPLQRAQVAFIAAPDTLPKPGDGPTQCKAWNAKIVEKAVAPVGADSWCGVHLDPRDRGTSPIWLKDHANANARGGLNSRLLFNNAELHSTFFSAPGRRFLLEAVNNAAARMDYLYDMIDGNQGMSLSGSLVFHPEGQFKISVPPHATLRASSGLNISDRDFVAGIATTEFFDLGADTDVTHIEFVKHMPAFLLQNEAEPSPIKRELLGDQKGLVMTSHIRFAKDGASTAVDLHAQSAEAPLFVPGGDHLQRLRKEIGSVGNAMPVFPHAGYQTGADDYERFRTFETTNLAQYRRKYAAPKAVHLAANAAPPRGITPQGILADINPDGSFSQLYFGNTDSSKLRNDFSLAIKNDGTQLYTDVQQALRANQLFMVFRKPQNTALNVVIPSTKLYARDDFAFTAYPLGTGTGATAWHAAAVIVKYFKGKSLAGLLGSPSVWACQSDFAPAGNADLEDWSPFKAGKPIPDYLKRLHDAVWVDPDWEGVLVLDLPMIGEPDLISALRPGLVVSDRARPPLSATYFGINALAAKNADLTQNSAPQRPGSAFAQVRYENPDAEKPDAVKPDPPPTRDDVEPGVAPGDDSQDERKYELIVKLLQITIENSQIAEFKATVLVRFNHLFWDKLTPPRGDPLNSLELDGYYERRGDQDIFSLVSPNQINVPFPQDSYLKQFTVTRAQLGVTSSDSQQLVAFISIDGTIQLSEKIAKLPFFTVKQIRLSTFGFQYSFKNSGGAVSAFKFGFSAGNISADIDFSPGDAQGLLSFLPVKLTGMSIAFSNLLDLNDLHFTTFPAFDSHLGTKFHFGFLMELDFGSLGQLAGDLRGMKIPMLLGWGGGKNKGLAFGIQFPTRQGKGIDIGIQQFIRLQADELNIVTCKDAQQNLQAIAIQAVKARVVMLGKAWPNADTSFAIFIPAGSQRKPSWALGVKKDEWYVGGGYRLNLPQAGATTVKSIVDSFYKDLSDVGDVCSLVTRNLAAPSVDEWSIVGRYTGELNVNVAISDPTIYGIAVEIPPFGELDVMYRRVNSQLGIFSIEYTLPGALRTMQIGAATVRLPVFRLEIHTDGGFLVDFGFPWNNDFSRSCQVEIAIFLGSGGFYYGVTSAAAADLLNFEGGYGYSPPDSAKLNELRTLRLGFAARVGIGRSFTIGILEAEASVTIFGGVEGAIAYRPGSDLFSPTLYAVKGYVGLMVDIRATVNFSIIRATAHILAYADVGFEIQRVLAKNPLGEHRIVSPPIVIFAEFNLSVAVDVQIHIGCVDITIHLSFNATWHYEERLTDFKDEGPYDHAISARPQTAALLAAPAFSWNTAYRYWPGGRDLDVYATVLPCMASAADVGETGGNKTCAVGAMLLSVDQPANGFGDLARFLVGWVLLPAGSDPSTYDSYQLTLSSVNQLQELMRDADKFWQGFAAAALAVTGAQFTVKLNTLASGQTDTFTPLPLWPDTTFEYVPFGGGPPTIATPSLVIEDGSPMTAARGAFVEYCHRLISGTIPEIRQLIVDKGYVRNSDGSITSNSALPPNDPRKSLLWVELWQHMFATLANGN